MEGLEEFTLTECREGTEHTKIPVAESPGIIAKISYSAGGMGAGFVWITAASFLPVYCTDVAEMSTGMVGIIMMISILLDGILDLYMGSVIGRTRTKWGKARPWILWSALPMALCLILLFHIPDIGSFHKSLYLLVTYFLMSGICFTVFGLPYNTMLSLTAENSYERNIMNTVRFEMILLVQLVISIITMPLVRYLGGGQEAWTTIAGSYAILSVLLSLIAFKGTKERNYNVEKPSSAIRLKDINPILTLKILYSNKYSLLLTVVTVVSYASLGMSSGARIYYAKYVLGNEDLNSIMVMFTLIPTIVILFFIPQLSRRFGKIRVLFGGGVLYGTGLIFMTAAPQELPAIYAGLILQGAGQAGLYSCLFAVTGDVAEYCKWKDGILEESLIYSMTAFGQKTGTGIGLVMLMISLALGGYSAETAASSAIALFSIKALYLYIPMALTMLVLFLWYLLMEFDNNYSSAQREYGHTVECRRCRKEGNNVKLH